MPGEDDVGVAHQGLDLGDAEAPGEQGRVGLRLRLGQARGDRPLPTVERSGIAEEAPAVLAGTVPAGLAAKA